MEKEEMEAKIKILENQVRILQDIEEIKKLQRAYGYYLEHWMAQEVIDCFADGPDTALIIWVGTYLGKEGIKRYFSTYWGGQEISPEFLHEVMQLSGIVDVESDGKTAKGRWYGWGVIALPFGGGITQAFMGGIYQAEYVKQDGKWKFKRLEFNRTLHFRPGEGWVKPERVAAVDQQKIRQPIVPDLPRAYEPGYPSGYIIPFHYKHPVTGKETTEGIRNSSLKSIQTG
jgi:hypothetical protein